MNRTPIRPVQLLSTAVCTQSPCSKIYQEHRQAITLERIYYVMLSSAVRRIGKVRILITVNIMGLGKIGEATIDLAFLIFTPVPIISPQRFNPALKPIERQGKHPLFHQLTSDVHRSGVIPIVLSHRVQPDRFLVMIG